MHTEVLWKIKVQQEMIECLNRGCVGMGVTGAMVPNNFNRDAFGTHEIQKFIYIAIS